MLRKIFKDYRPVPWKIVEKETVDEIIFRTPDQRNRLILELMARGGMRIGEVLKLTPSDIDGGRISIQAPKSGRQTEVAFVPQKLAHRLGEYIRQKGSRTEGKDLSHFLSCGKNGGEEGRGTRRNQPEAP